MPKSDVPSGSEILRVEGLTKFFPVKKKRIFDEKHFVHAVEDVTFSLAKEETLGVVGESGSGKSTLARTILALLQPTSGKVFFEGNDITGFKHGNVGHLRQSMQMIFQDPYASLNPKLKIGDAIAEPMLQYKLASGRADAKSKVQDLLELMGLRREVYDRYPHEFSGGQRQRIGIARALATDPSIVFCDESVSALDVSVQAQILNLFVQLRQERNLTYVFISHDLAVVKYVSDRILVMYLGKVMEIAASDELFGDDIHPYTRALISAIPEPSTAPRKERIILEGDIPSPVDPPAGCRFCQRCYMKQAICSQVEPELREVSPGHFVACHFVGGESA